MQHATFTISSDASFNSVTVGKGANSVANGNTVLGAGCFRRCCYWTIIILAVGKDALTSHTSGSNVTAVGAFALDANTSASNNSAFGYRFSIRQIPLVHSLQRLE